MIKLLEAIKFINENMIFFICNIFCDFMVLTNSGAAGPWLGGVVPQPDGGELLGMCFFLSFLFFDTKGFYKKNSPELFFVLDALSNFFLTKFFSISLQFFFLKKFFENFY